MTDKPQLTEDNFDLDNMDIVSQTTIEHDDSDYDHWELTMYLPKSMTRESITELIHEIIQAVTEYPKLKKQSECLHYHGEEVDPSTDEKWRRCLDCGWLDKSYQTQLENKKLKAKIEELIRKNQGMADLVTDLEMKIKIEQKTVQQLKQLERIKNMDLEFILKILYRFKEKYAVGYELAIIEKCIHEFHQIKKLLNPEGEKK